MILSSRLTQNISINNKNPILKWKHTSAVLSIVSFASMHSLGGEPSSVVKTIHAFLALVRQAYSPRVQSKHTNINLYWLIA